jgi:hypothetical protein
MGSVKDCQGSETAGVHQRMNVGLLDNQGPTAIHVVLVQARELTPH